MINLSSYALLATVFFTLKQYVNDYVYLSKSLDAEGHAIAPISVQMSHTISAFPVITCLISFACLFFPATAYSLELAIAIFACVVLGSLTHYFLHSLGSPPEPGFLLARVPEKRWWCGALCGGFSDPLPCLGLMWSKESHRITLRDLRTACHMVSFFMFAFISLSAFQTGISIIPASVQKHPDGWCYSTGLVQDTLTLTVIIIGSILATFVGASGLSVITAAVNLALCDEEAPVEKQFNVQQKAAAGFIYIQLPLLKLILNAIHMGSKSPTVPVAQTTTQFITREGQWTTSGITLACPLLLLSFTFYFCFIFRCLLLFFVVSNCCSVFQQQNGSSLFLL